ncbi:syntaxin-like protein psy1 [Diaporthe amygdali]|uniref:syntaxin-like protein psy1 n=1 Tax=Phomopsis amygdali TaxID=1214568 RepID=UPI0022FE2A00|nr:syntaxin-like protein psy1 [Diaporthe amygdali]KAJ0119327.1 syntaxin-like protein psy1 [Diaporthe amygdali]
MSHSQYSGNPYQSGPAQESGYGNSNPYGAPEQHELQQISPGQNPYGSPQSANVLSQQDFLQRVSHVRNEIRSLTADVQRIAGLHHDALVGSDDTAQRRLDDLVASTQLKNTGIRDQIKSLKSDVERTTDGSAPMKKRQFEALNGDFKKELQNYLQEEQQYRERYRDQIARQYRIVNPEASEDEVRQAADADWGNEGVFQTALRTNRSGQASAVLGNVRARHNELLRIEQSITELAGIFQDLDTLVIQQEAIVERAEEQTEQANQHLQEGNKQVDVGITHARRTRKLKWWCALVVFLICLAIGLGVGLGVYFSNKAKNTATNATQ